MILPADTFLKWKEAAMYYMRTVRQDKATVPARKKATTQDVDRLPLPPSVDSLSRFTDMTDEEISQACWEEVCKAAGVKP